MLWLPAVTVADELEIFESLAREPASAAELAERHGFQLRGADILLSLLTALKFCVSHLGRYQLTDPTRNYLLLPGFLVEKITINGADVRIEGRVNALVQELSGAGRESPRDAALIDIARAKIE